MSVIKLNFKNFSTKKNNDQFSNGNEENGAKKTGTHFCYCRSAGQPGTAKGSCYKSQHPWEQPHLCQP